MSWPYATFMKRSDLLRACVLSMGPKRLKSVLSEMGIQVKLSHQYRETVRGRMFDMLQKGAHVDDVARKYDVSTATVYQSWRRNSQGQGRKPRVHRKDEKTADRVRFMVQVRDLYDQGMSLDEVGRQVGLTRERVRQLLVLMGHTKRHYGSGRRQEERRLQADAVLQAYREAERPTLSDIFLRTGVNITSISEILKENGLGIRRHKIAAADHERIRQRYEAGESAMRIARAYDVSTVTMLRLLKMMGVKVRSVGGTRAKTAQERKALVASYERLRSVARVAREQGVAPMTVRRYLLEAGVDVRQNSGKLSEEDRKRIRDLVAEGLTRTEVAARFKVNINTIRRHCEPAETRRVSEDVKERIRRRVAEGCPKAKAAREFGVSETTVRNCCCKKPSAKGENRG